MTDSPFNRILISRTDNIGDVVLTLPMAGAIKQKYPNAKILFLGKKYTKAVVECSENIDEFYDWDEIKKLNNKKEIFKNLKCDTIIHVFPNIEISKLAKEAKIKNRIGTNRRLFHWIYCNKKVSLSRKNSDSHECQLNLKLLEPLNIKDRFELKSIPDLYGFNKIQKLPEKYIELIDKKKFNLILHPKSKGSAREWGSDNFVTLINSLPNEHFNIFITGGKEESLFIKENIIQKAPHAKDLSGLLTLTELIAFIKSCDGLIANSTGPLHIASALGIHVLGLYPPIKSMMPKRWAPIGKQAEFTLGISSNDNSFCISPCTLQKKCLCMENISPLFIKEIIEKWHSSPHS